MKLCSLIVFVGIVSLILMTSGCNNDENKRLTTISDDISKGISQLQNNSLMHYMGSSVDLSKKTSKVLLTIDKKKISFDLFKEVAQSYISSLESYSTQDDWQKEFKEYSFKIEEMPTDRNGPITLAEKTPESTEITWYINW